MYKFADTTAGSAESTSMLLQTIFDNINLDEELTDGTGSFVTLSVSGRGILPRRIVMKETPYRHGVRENDFTYDVREITIKYKLTDQTNEGFRERFNQLNGLLLGSKKMLEFTDEDAYFYATLQGGDTPEEDSNSIVATLTFLCSDPAKYKASKELSVTGEFETYTVHSQAPTHWTSRTVFSSSADQYELETVGSGYILLNYGFIDGDVLEIDYRNRRVTLNNEKIDVAVSLNSHWFDLKPGDIQLRVSHDTTIAYTERYY